MGVHDIASYVKYHQEKLRAEQQAQAPLQKRKTGVDSLNSKEEFLKAINEQVNPQGESHKDSIIFLDAFATWCGPCKMIAPKIAEMSNTELGQKVAFYKFDVDAVPDLAQELGVRAMPTFYLFKPGETLPVETIVGANPKAIEAGIQKVLDGAA